MFCTKCGAQNQDGARACGVCGAPLMSARVESGDLNLNVGGTGASRPYVPNYLVQSILVTFFCCLPCGIPAIVYAAQVDGKVASGDIAGAQQASKNAKMWCWISVGGWGAIVVVYLLMIAAAVMSGAAR